MSQHIYEFDGRTHSRSSWHPRTSRTRCPWSCAN